MSATQRFLNKVQREGRCIRWTGTLLPNGYGNFRGEHSRMILAHRFAYEAFVGPIPGGLQIDHLCRNRWCVNPAHLEPVTCRENALRGAAPSVQIHLSGKCSKGHDDFRVVTSGGRTRRVCRTCGNDRSREFQRMKRAQARVPR